MNALRLAGLLVFTLGAFAYGAILVLWVRELGRLGWGARPVGRERTIDLVNGALVSVSFVWFLLNIAVVLLQLGPRRDVWQIELATVAVAFLFPPLIVHVTWAEVATEWSDRRSLWRLLLALTYVVAVALPVWCVSTIAAGSTPPWLHRMAQQLLGGGLSVLFLWAAAASVLLGRRSLRARQRDARATLGLYALMAVLFAGIFVASIVTISSRAAIVATEALSIAARSLPLLFLFVGTYYENRFQFFDLFVKRGAGLLLALAVLTAWFAAVLPALAPLARTWAAPWIFAIALLPVVALMPLLYATMARALDRRWLGRQFTTIEAVTRFLGGLRSATSSAALVTQAEERLSEIFDAPAAVRLDQAGRAEFEVAHETSHAAPPFRFLLGHRRNHAPYFSQDAALLRTLAGVFASALENAQLQERRRAEEQRVRELSLHATRSELKALRAQINPHFLFNALNAIAGHIHRDPARADRTVEQLADVFRYTLRGAEQEWTLLRDEVDFVRAYLEVERARFGDRLEVTIDITHEAGRLRLPTMMLQTLVENAVKHGAARVRGRAVIRIRADATGGRAVVSVTDNGPGFDAAEADAPARRRGGYGLANIRERLEGHYEGSATLDVQRDDRQGLTTVSIIIPAAPDPALSAGGGSR